MEIDIIGTPYFITQDKYQFILNETTKAKRKDTGEEYELDTAIGYYPNLQQIYNRISHLMLSKEQVESFQELLDFYNQVGQTVLESIKEVHNEPE